ncbi:TPA: redoxin domain-containing protein, partial [Bacillus cereus]|nr:redoxin domain-containing protein [Bacillus cereus]
PKSLDVGEYIENVYIDTMNTCKLHDILKKHLLILFYSTSCEGCLPSMEALDKFLTKDSSLNVLILIDTSPENFEYIKSTFEGRALVSLCNKDKMKKEFKVSGVPRTYFVNELGQVLYAEIGYQDNMFEDIITKFKCIIEY